MGATDDARTHWRPWVVTRVCVVDGCSCMHERIFEKHDVFFWSGYGTVAKSPSSILSSSAKEALSEKGREYLNGKLRIILRLHARITSPIYIGPL